MNSASQILEVGKEINDFLELIPAHILLDAKGHLVDLKNIYP